MARSLIAAHIFVVGVVFAVSTQVTVQRLETATANQCLQHDWPVKAHELHMAWCAANNYPTN
jgi:hypothetical protein